MHERLQQRVEPLPAIRLVPNNRRVHKQKIPQPLRPVLIRTHIQQILKHLMIQKPHHTRPHRHLRDIPLISTALLREPHIEQILPRVRHRVHRPAVHRLPVGRARASPLVAAAEGVGLEREVSAEERLRDFSVPRVAFVRGPVCFVDVVVPAGKGGAEAFRHAATVAQRDGGEVEPVGPHFGRAEERDVGAEAVVEHDHEGGVREVCAVLGFHRLCQGLER
mmetsp:Transcript_26558/g.66576  ORF Transcript_26558/g.66576 Transcript_26558/m.66576 type:complete len:221 (-) Transcript_26558:488-1150(-)